MAELAHPPPIAGLGRSCLRPATPADAIDGVAPRWVAEPAAPAEVAGILQSCNQAALHVVPRGGGSKIDWGNPPRALDVVLSTRKMDAVLEHAASDMTATVQAGCTVAALQKRLLERGQRLAVDPLWPERATIGGIIATNDSGALRAAYGTLRDQLIGVTVVLADGTIARSGGKVVKNVAGYDLPKLFTGSFGTLGVITEATFRLYSIPRAQRALRMNLATPADLSRAIDALMNLSLLTLAVQFEARAGASIVLTVLAGGVPEAMDAKVQRILREVAVAGVELAEPSEEAWSARQRLFAQADPASCIAQVSLLPTQWPALIQRMSALPHDWSVVAQLAGAATVRLPDLPALDSLRRDVAQAQGTLLVLRCPSSAKGQIDCWPDPGAALPLMRRVKEQFDPRSTLSPGRFMGGI